MKLYHYTMKHRLAGIAKYGLTIGDVPTDLRHSKSEVGVWLTSSDKPTGHGLSRKLSEAICFRLTVELAQGARGLVRWSEWASDNVTFETIQNLKESAGKDGVSQ